MDDWRANARARAKEMSQGETFKLAEGNNIFRVMPNIDSATKKLGSPYIEFRVHRNVGPEDKFVGCGKRPDMAPESWEPRYRELGMNGKCWLCDVQIPELMRHPNRRAQADSITSKNQIMVVASMYDPAQNRYSKPKPWWVSTGKAKSLSVALLKLLGNPIRPWEHPVKGYNINCERTGSGMKDTRYGPFIPDTDPSPLPTALWQGLPSIWTHAPRYSEQEQRAAFKGEKVQDATAAYAEEADAQTDDGYVADDPPQEGDGDDPFSNSEALVDGEGEAEVVETSAEEITDESGPVYDDEVPTAEPDPEEGALFDDPVEAEPEPPRRTAPRPATQPQRRPAPAPAPAPRKAPPAAPQARRTAPAPAPTKRAAPPAAQPTRKPAGKR